jgi:hypothetical protein
LRGQGWLWRVSAPLVSFTIERFPSRTEKEATLNDPRFRKLIRNFVIEVLIYSVLVVGYFSLVLRFLGEPLEKLFTTDLTVYAFAGLALIVVQGAVLELITSFLLNRLGLESLE